MSLKSIILQSLFVLLFCTSFLSAAPVAVDTTNHNPFRPDEYNNLIAYVGSITYPGNTQITRQFLVSEAKRVWDYVPDGPGMVSALFTGSGDGKIYFATSIKGDGKDLGFPPFLADELHKCVEERNNLGFHVFEQRCAELMVIAEWSQETSKTKLPDKGKLIVAVDRSRKVAQPCSKDTQKKKNLQPGIQFGCDEVLHKLGFVDDEMVKTDPGPELSCPMRRRGFGGLIERGCVSKKPTAKHSPPGKPAPKKPTAQAPQSQSKPKPPSNNTPKSTPPKMPAKPKPGSNKGPKH